MTERTNESELVKCVECGKHLSRKEAYKTRNGDYLHNNVCLNEWLMENDYPLTLPTTTSINLIYA